MAICNAAVNLQNEKFLDQFIFANWDEWKMEFMDLFF